MGTFKSARIQYGLQENLLTNGNIFGMKSDTKFLRETTVLNYSSRNASFYDDPMNKNFVYGALTIDFVNKIELNKTDKIIADIGCGTGFAFDIIYDKLIKYKTKCSFCKKYILHLALSPSF